MSEKHAAAVLQSPGSPLVLVERITPEPGPQEILIETKALAVNPVDWYQRDHGRPPTPAFFPAILGSDVAGLVAKVGSGVPEPPAPGSRALAFASSFYHEGSNDHGGFQKFVVARFEGVVPLPHTMAFEEGAIMPLATLTALSAYTTLEIPLGTELKPEDKQGVLIWGASSSVGTLAVQTAKYMGFSVYATAGAQNLGYIKTLGADAVFDYKSPDSIPQIANQVKKDGIDLRTAHVIVDNALRQTLDVLQLTRGGKPAKVAHAPVLSPDAPTREGIDVRFTFPPTGDEERNRHIYQCFHVYLKSALGTGAVVPSPTVRVVEGGLAGLNEALDVLKAGVSATKIVVLV